MLGKLQHHPKKRKENKCTGIGIGECQKKSIGSHTRSIKKRYRCIPYCYAYNAALNLMQTRWNHHFYDGGLHKRHYIFLSYNLSIASNLSFEWAIIILTSGSQFHFLNVFNMSRAASPKSIFDSFGCTTWFIGNKQCWVLKGYKMHCNKWWAVFDNFM